MFCAISEQPAKEPVTTAATGLIYEKGLLLKHLAQEKTCPVTKLPLTEDDVILLKSPASVLVAPRPPSFTSLPTLLTAFQNEWDSTVLELVDLRNKYIEARQELGYALYREDAAKRVVARLLRERNEARETLESLQSVIAAGHAQNTTLVETAATTDDMQVDEPSTTSELEQVFMRTFEELSKERKQKRGAAPLEETVKQLKLVLSFPSLHSSTQPGISSVDISTSGLYATGGNDKAVLFLDQEGKLLHTGKGHQKKVTKVEWSGGHLLSCGLDKQARIWEPAQNNKAFKSAHIFKSHQTELVSLSCHPSNEFFVTIGKNGSWAIHSLQQKSTLHVVNDENPVEYSCGSFHPDGMILACGTTQGSVRIWDVLKQTIGAELSEPLTGRVTSLAFSENGYYLAVSDETKVTIWDLRKTSCIKQLNVADVKNLAWDPSGTFLATVGMEVRVFKGGKGSTWPELVRLEDAVEVLLSVCWKQGQLVTGGIDRCLRTYSH